MIQHVNISESVSLLALIFERCVCFSSFSPVFTSFYQFFSRVLTVSHQGRGAKSAGSWDPRCQKVFEESGSGRKFWTISTHFSGR